MGEFNFSDKNGSYTIPFDPAELNFVYHQCNCPEAKFYIYNGDIAYELEVDKGGVEIRLNTYNVRYTKRERRILSDRKRLFRAPFPKNTLSLRALVDKHISHNLLTKNEQPITNN